MSDQPLLAWHFLPADRRLRYVDRTLVEPGQTLTVDPPLSLCSHGLHFSIRPLAALEYAPGPIVCRVEVSGEILHGVDKGCAQYRKVLWMADATRVLHLFACDEAERALAAAGVDDPRCLAAIATKRRWLDGEATDAELDAAWDAAWAAAWAAARDAAWAAARAAAWAAARDAAGAAAWAAAGAAAWDAQNERLAATLHSLQPREAA